MKMTRFHTFAGPILLGFFLLSTPILGLDFGKALKGAAKDLKSKAEDEAQKSISGKEEPQKVSKPASSKRAAATPPSAHDITASRCE